MRAALVLFLLTLVASDASADDWRPTLVYETGPSYVLQNDGQYGAIGTRFDAGTVGQQDNLVRTSRTSLELANGRHVLLLLYAPFELRTQVTLDRELQFRDALFASGTVVDHRYLFDGYRASYLYRVLEGRLALELGGSLQIRSAEVAFTATDGSLRAEQDDIGVVPALKARLRWQPQASSLWAALEADGSSTFGLLDGTSGGLYDVQLTLGHPVGRGVEIFLGARLLGGGADVDDQQIDNWANFLSFTAGARIALDDLLGTRTPR
ncbi:MAG TPA: hypothetical protein VFQ53_36775 [Kofleriaceae bacterium]|nr:hypothetical protein [Kofleriaceae bacterium]